jgi:hypothetical protein
MILQADLVLSYWIKKGSVQWYNQLILFIATQVMGQLLEMGTISGSMIVAIKILIANVLDLLLCIIMGLAKASPIRPCYVATLQAILLR